MKYALKGFWSILHWRLWLPLSQWPIASAEGYRFPSYCCYGDLPPIAKHMLWGLHVFEVKLKRSWEQFMVLILQLHVGNWTSIWCNMPQANSDSLTNWHGEWPLVTCQFNLFVLRHTMLWPPFAFPQVLNELLVLDFLGDNGLALNQSLSSILFQ